MKIKLTVPKNFPLENVSLIAKVANMSLLSQSSWLADCVGDVIRKVKEIGEVEIEVLGYDSVCDVDSVQELCERIVQNVV